jgi:hypothetical protein
LAPCDSGRTVSRSVQTRSESEPFALTKNLTGSCQKESYLYVCTV